MGPWSDLVRACFTPKEGGDVFKRTALLTLSLLIVLAGMPAAMAQGRPQTITEAEAQAIAVDAYVYFYPLVTMDVTRKQFTNIEAGKEFGKGPMNTFNNIPAYPPADFKAVVPPGPTRARECRPTRGLLVCCPASSSSWSASR
jgi:hypothetical protein